MLEKSIRHLPVMDKGRLYGVLSDRDVKLACAVADNVTDLEVKDACVANPFTFSESTLLSTVLQEMASRRFGSALIVKNGKLTGVFTTTDACRYFARFLEKTG